MNRELSVVAILLMIGLPVIVVAAGVYCYFQPRLYSATVEFRLDFPGKDGPLLQSAYERAIREYPGRMKQPLTSRIIFKPSAAPNQYRITAIDADPQGSANSANFVAISIVETLTEASKEEGRRVTFVQKAERPLAPSFPDVRLIMRAGVALGFVSGIGGVILLFVTNRRRGPEIPR